MPMTVQEYEETFVHTHRHPEIWCFTPESAIVGILPNTQLLDADFIFADFGEAVCWCWLTCEDRYTARWIPDDQAPEQLREARPRFRALLTRFCHDGYASDMGRELDEIVRDVTDAEHQIRGVRVLPEDAYLYIPDWWGDAEADDYFADLDAAREPIPDFDIANPKHFEILSREIERRCAT